MVQDICYENMSGVSNRGVTASITNCTTTESSNSVSRRGRESTSWAPDTKMKAADRALSLKKENQSPTPSSSYSTCLSLGNVDILQKSIVVENEKDENDGIVFERESQIEQLYLADRASIGPSRRTDELDMLEDEIRAYGRNDLKRNDVAFSLEKCEFITRPRESNRQHNFRQLQVQKEVEVRHDEDKIALREEPYKHSAHHRSEKELSVETGPNDFDTGAITHDKPDVEGKSNNPLAPISKFSSQQSKAIYSISPASKNSLHHVEDHMARSGRENSEQTPRLPRSSSLESKRTELAQRKLEAESTTKLGNESVKNDSQVGRLDRRRNSFVTRKNSLTNIEIEVESKVQCQQSLKKSAGNIHTQEFGSMRRLDARAESIAGLQSRRSSFTSRRSSFTSHPVNAIELSLDKLEDGALKNSDHSSTDRAKMEATRLNRISTNDFHRGRTRSLDHRVTLSHSPPRAFSLPVPHSLGVGNTKESIGVPPGSLAPGAYRAHFYDSDEEEIEITMDFSDETDSEEEQNQRLEASLNHSQNQSQNGSSLRSFASQESLTQPIETAPVAFPETSPSSDSDDRALLTRLCSPKTRERKWFLVILLTCGLILGIALAVPVAMLVIVEPQINTSDYTTATDKHVCPEHKSMTSILDQCKTSRYVEHISKCASDLYAVLQERLSVNIGPPTGICKPDRLALLSMIIFKQNPSISNYALSTLYFSTDGPTSWKNDDGWITSKNICTWHGIGCKIRNQTLSTSQPFSITDEVEKIELANNKLNGYIPPQLEMLKALELLNLSKNALTGEIPMEMGNLRNLTVVDLSENSDIGGTIPTTMALLQNLKVFIASDMALSGDIPSQVGGMSSLQRLELSSNILTHLPSEIGNLNNLKHLEGNNNMLTGQLPAELGNCTNLKSLVLGTNSFSGGIPSELGLLTRLTYLSISYNNFDKNPLPLEIIRQPSNLTLLDLSFISLSGNIPTDIALLKGLRELQLSGNDLTGSIPTELGLCENLESLELRNNRIQGQIPSELGYLTKLNHFFLSNNQLIGELPSEIGMMTGLKFFLFGSNHLSGVISSEICNLWDYGLQAFGSIQQGEKHCDAYFGGTICPEDTDCCPQCQS